MTKHDLNAGNFECAPKESPKYPKIWDFAAPQIQKRYGQDAHTHTQAEILKRGREVIFTRYVTIELREGAPSNTSTPTHTHTHTHQKKTS